MKNTTTAIAIIAAATTVASADIIDMKYTGVGAGRNVKININDSSFNAFAGEIEHQIQGAESPNTFLNGTLYTYCADITEHVATDFSEYQVTSQIGYLFVSYSSANAKTSHVYITTDDDNEHDISRSQILGVS